MKGISRRKSKLGAVAIATAFALILSATTAANADDHSDELSRVVEAAAPTAGQPGREVSLRSDARDAKVETGGAAVTVPLNPDKPIEVASAHDGDSPALTIGLPENATGKASGEVENANSVAFEGEDAHSVVQTFDHGIRIATVIEDAKASHEYSYDLPADVTPVLNADGSVALEAKYSHGDDAVTIRYGTVDAPWAADANGVSVPTYYKVADGKLTQVVEHSAKNAFPVIADPTYWWGWNAFISNSVHKKLVDAWTTGVAVVGIANLFVGYIPIKQLQLAIRLVSAMFGAGLLLFKACNARGKGVIIGQATILSLLPAVGPFGFVRNGFFCLPQ